MKTSKNPSKFWLLFPLLGALVLFLFFFWPMGKKGFNLAVNSSFSSLIFSLNSKKKTASVILVPENTYLEVPGGYGNYQLKAIWKLGETEGKGGELFANSLQEFQGVPIDGFMGGLPIEITNNNDVIPLKRYLSSPWLLNGILTKRIKTNISLRTAIWFIFNLKKVPDHKVYFYNLADSECLKNSVLADQTEVKIGEEYCLDKISQDFFLEEELRQENIPVAILNSTDFPGLATHASRILENIGVRVIMVGEEKKKQTNSTIIGNPRTLSSKTGQKIKSIFNAEENRQTVEGLTLVLGSDYLRFLKGND